MLTGTLVNHSSEIGDEPLGGRNCRLLTADQERNEEKYSDQKKLTQRISPQWRSLIGITQVSWREMKQVLAVDQSP